MAYLNDLYPYKDIAALACFYSYEITGIFHGNINLKKQLVISKEVIYERKDITYIGEILIKHRRKIWINQNNYLADVIGNCYCLNFDDEVDYQQLTDLFTSLIENNRVIFEYEKKPNKIRDKGLMLLTKALSYALFQSTKSASARVFVGGKLKTFSD